METVCHNQLIFESLFGKEVIGDFAGGRITSDAGGLLLREVDQRYRLAEKAARCLHDSRQAKKVKHELLTLVRQRPFAIALGFAEQPDWIRELPLIKCDHPHISMEIVALSDAVGVILLPMIEQELIAGQFVLLPVSFPEFKTHAGIVRLKNRTPSPVVEVLVDLLLEIDEAVFKTEQDLEQKFFKPGYYITPSA